MKFGYMPEWVCFVLTLIFVLFSLEAGYRLGLRRKFKPGDNPETAAGSMSATALGLLAFMLAFTFNGASNHHDLRKDLIFNEANAIRTTYNQSMLLPEPYSAKAHDLLKEYVDIRIKIRQSRGVGIKQALERTVAIQKDLWSIVVALQKTDPGSSVVSSFSDSLNTLSDLHVKRAAAAMHNRISFYIWMALYLLTFITMSMMGYRIGLEGVRSVFIEISLALAFSLVLLLITALDRPLGIIGVSQQPLISVQKILATS